MNVGIVTSIRKIEGVAKKLDLMDIVIDNIPYKLFGDYPSIIKYIDMAVLYSTMPDIYQGKRIERIVDLAEKRVVTTTNATKESRLLPASTDVDPICNFDMSTLHVSMKQERVILYLSAFAENASDKSKWFELKVVDVRSRVYNLRYYSSFGRAMEETRDVLSTLLGHYIITDVVNTIYGIQVAKSSEIELHPVDVVLKPEVEIAVKIIEDVCSGDKELLEYMNSYSYIPKMKTLINVEPGYYLIAVAMELSIITAVENITDTINRRTLIRTAITSRGYLIDKQNELSKPILNINKILRSPLKTDLDLINTLDVLSLSSNPSKRTYIEIAKFVRHIIDERRGVIDDKKIVSSITDISDMFGGLL